MPKFTSPRPSTSVVSVMTRLLRDLCSECGRLRDCPALNCPTAAGRERRTGQDMSGAGRAAAAAARGGPESVQQGVEGGFRLYNTVGIR